MIDPGGSSEAKSTDIGWGGTDTVFRYSIYKINKDGSELHIGTHIIKIGVSALSFCNGSYFNISVEPEGLSTVAVMSKGVIGGDRRTIYEEKLKTVYLSDWIK